MPHQQHTDPPQLPQIQTQLSEATALRLLSRVTVSSAAPQLQQLQEPAAQTQQPPDTEMELQPDTETQLHPPETQSPEIQLLPETPLQPPTTTQTQPETDNDICCTSAAGCGPSTSVEPTTGTSRQLGVALPEPGQATHSSQDSVHSANEFGNSCRICRYNSSDMEIINCPCKCKGSVGYIHMKCLKRWIMHRRDNRCEICHSQFNITADRASVKQMVRAFCCGRCCGMIMKHVLFSASLMPLAHVILQQVLHCMDNLNQGNAEQLTVQEVFVASCALLTSSALFFHFFEFVTTRFLLIRNILRHWWMFGSTNDFGLVEVEDDAFDLF